MTQRTPTPAEAAAQVRALSKSGIERLNALARGSLQTRGGRQGSGLGSLLEALWGFSINTELLQLGSSRAFDVAWFPGHSYNDFACISLADDWNPETREGELLRIEAKSMYVDADESKGHFDALMHEIHEDDLLLILIWGWERVNTGEKQVRVAPRIRDWFIEKARPIAKLRDELHRARSGSFVVEGKCPDGCPGKCKHFGEPLNADGKRERRTGPESRKPANVPYAANFGGLVRMLKTSSEKARQVFRVQRRQYSEVHQYISFIHRNFQREEDNQYLRDDWMRVAEKLGIKIKPQASMESLRAAVRSNANYVEALRALV